MAHLQAKLRSQASQKQHLVAFVKLVLQSFFAKLFHYEMKYFAKKGFTFQSFAQPNFFSCIQNGNLLASALDFNFAIKYTLN